MKIKEKILKNTVGHEYYDPSGIVYIPQETVLLAMEKYANQFKKDFPTDEEIELAAKNNVGINHLTDTFIEGANWLKSKLT